MARWGKTEFGDLKAFNKKLDDFLKTQTLLEDVARELTARLLAIVIPRTPVGQYPASTGKVGGTLRRGWTSDSHGEAEINSSTDIDSYVNSMNISKSGDYIIVEVTNPVEYAKYVELGHRTRNHKSWVEGQHFLRISVNELNSQKEGIVKKIVYDELKELFL